MIPNTAPYYVFIQISIWILRAITPLSAAYCVARALGYGTYIPVPLQVIAYAEVTFYCLVSLPRQVALDRSRPRPVNRTRKEREALFERCFDSVPDLEAFLSVWFNGAALDKIHRQDLKDWLAWGFLYKTRTSSEDDDEMEEYVRRIERRMNRRFPFGRGPFRPSQVSTDPLVTQHKPLLFYVIAVGGDDLMTYLRAEWIGLQHYRLPMYEFLTTFPCRPHTLLSQHVSPCDRLSYWYRPHTSRKRKPVLLIHGIGAGMRTYIGFLNDFMQRDALDDDGEVGIIALELMNISMRITKKALVRPDMLAAILKILEYHGWDQFVVLGHSYGTILATHLLQHLGGTGRVGSMLLVDPVAISIHWGGIPFCFLYRRPRKASEWQLHYFASTDMCVAHTITRRFDWTENVLWREDMRDRAITVALADEDIIMNNVALRKYLIDDGALKTRVYNATTRDWSYVSGRGRGSWEGEKGMDVLWYEGLNHAEIWERARDWTPLVDVLQCYCAMA